MNQFHVREMSITSHRYHVALPSCGEGASASCTSIFLWTTIVCGKELLFSARKTRNWI